MVRSILIAIVPVAFAAGFARADDRAAREGVEFFEKKIRPVLVERCYACHSVAAKKAQGRLRLDSRAGLLKGGDTGPAVVPGEPDKSPLIKAIRYGDALIRMPPREQDRLSPEQVADFEAWVKAGAPDPRTDPATKPAAPGVDFAKARQAWPYSPLVDARPPAVAEPPAGAEPGDVDRFLLAKLAARGVRPLGPADRRTLIRRATLDLTGLPPSPEEVEAFVADGRPDAYERLIERLLASPAYGERWGRHWLDVVRYADTAGDNSDYPVPQLHLYRDYVIAAFNADKPFDRFVVEQIAGDLLPWANESQRREQIVATGYLAGTKRFGSRVDDYPWHLTIEDTIDNLGRAFLGLSLSCARCHDHKFDPITGEDYYALYGIFAGTRYPWPGIELDKVPRDFVPLIPAEQAAALDKAKADKLAALDGRIKKAEAEKKAADEALKSLEKDAKAGRARPSEAAARKKAEELKAAVDRLKKERDRTKIIVPYETAYAVAEGGKPGNVRLHIRGQPENPGREVPRRFLQVFGGPSLPSATAGSGRLELAQWLTRDAAALVARVAVNRIWQHHFGRGIVPTPNDFGRQGVPPTHPELLDYLAGKFIASGWSIKAMHRLMMTSQAYRRAGGDEAGSAGLDPANEWLGRFPRRRLEAEAVRDSILAVAGTLDRSPPSGPHPFPDVTTWNFTQHKPFRAVYESNKRTVYLMTQRIARHPYLALFDGPDTNASTGRRVISTTALQALFFLNDPFIHEQAGRLAERLHREAADDAGRIDRACRLLLARPPTDAERAETAGYLAEFGRRLDAKLPAPERSRRAWESCARALLRLSEFVYLN